MYTFNDLVQREIASKKKKIDAWVIARLTLRPHLKTPFLTYPPDYVNDTFLYDIIIAFGYCGDFSQALTQITLWMESNPQDSKYFKEYHAQCPLCSRYFFTLVNYDLILEQYESARNRLIFLKSKKTSLRCLEFSFVEIILKFVDLLMNKKFTQEDINFINKKRLTPEYRHENRTDLNDDIDMILIIDKLLRKTQKNKALTELKQVYVHVANKIICINFLIVTCLGLMHVNEHRYAMPIIKKVLKMYENRKNINYYCALYFKCLIYAKYPPLRKTALKLIGEVLKTYPYNQTFLTLKQKIITIITIITKEHKERFEYLIENSPDNMYI